jgi:hypothetical protein
MTFTAQRDPRNDRQIIVRTTSGPVVNEVTEHAGHVRSFHGQLGKVLAEVEGKDPGQRAYERYCESSDGKSLVSGAELPGWDGLDEKIKAAWEHAAG